MANSNIGYYTKLRGEYVEKQNKYKNALSLCNNLIDELNKYKNSLNKIKDALMANFTINGRPADDGMTDQLIEKTANMSSIVADIISQIQTEITQLSNKITECDNQIAYLQKIEAEEKKKNES